MNKVCFIHTSNICSPLREAARKLSKFYGEPSLNRCLLPIEVVSSNSLLFEDKYESKGFIKNCMHDGLRTRGYFYIIIYNLREAEYLVKMLRNKKYI